MILIWTDFRNMGVKRWKTNTVGTTEWASVTREARPILKEL
jgi:hypothetical protein